MTEAIRFRRLRLSLRLEQIDFATLANCSASTVSRVESGLTSYRYTHIRALEQSLGLPIDILLELGMERPVWIRRYFELSTSDRAALSSIIMASIDALTRVKRG